MGEEVGPRFLLHRIQQLVGLGEGLARGVVLVLELGFPLSLSPGFAPRTSPNPYLLFPWWRLAAGPALPATW